MGDYIAVAVVIAILTTAVTYIVKQKKKGAKCIGCPMGCKACGNEKNKSSCCCGCKQQQSVDNKT